MDKTSAQESLQGILKVLVRVSKGFDNRIEDISNFWALNDLSNALDSFNSSLMNLFMSVI
jgi:hypothetical protein